jgi:hypothetical protein
VTTLLHNGQPGNPSFRLLLPEGHWQSLPAGTRRRFDAVFRPHTTACYVGHVTRARLSMAGWLLAQMCRLIGSPLPLFATPGPAAVTVTDHEGNGGQVWARCYHRRRGFAQCVQSVKRFGGPTGLEEYLGWGLTMPLTLEARAGTLVFRNAGYQLLIGQYRLNLPRLAHPGRLTVIHRELARDTFTFEMTLEHPLLGELIYQLAHFCEARTFETTNGEAQSAASVGVVDERPR